MGFLDKLWDETLAGPMPDTGLGRLRKYNSFSATRSPNNPLATSRFHHDHRHDDHTIPVSRSITIIRTKNISVEPGSGTSSPASSSGPSSPFSPGTPSNHDRKRHTRKKHEWDAMEHAEGMSPATYDWIIISALDR